MTKAELIKKVSAATDLSDAKAKAVIEAYENALITEVKGMGHYRIAGLGTIKGAMRGARTARNPQTGKEILVPEKQVVKFKTATDFSK